MSTLSTKEEPIQDEENLLTEGSLAQGTVQDYYSQAYDNDEEIKDTLQCEYCFQQYNVNTTDDQTMIDHVNDKHDVKFSNESDDTFFGTGKDDDTKYSDEDIEKENEKKRLSGEEVKTGDRVYFNGGDFGVVANQTPHGDWYVTSKGNVYQLPEWQLKVVSKEEGMASVSGPPAGTEPTVQEEEDNTFVLPSSNSEEGNLKKSLADKTRRKLPQRGLNEVDAYGDKEEVCPSCRTHTDAGKMYMDYDKKGDTVFDCQTCGWKGKKLAYEDYYNKSADDYDDERPIDEEEIPDPDGEEDFVNEGGPGSGPQKDLTKKTLTSRIKNFGRKSKPSNQDPDAYDYVGESDSIMLNENYIEYESILYRPRYTSEEAWSDDLVFENKFYTSEGVGNCQFCKGAGKVTVERLGLKDCPDCDGTGDVQGDPMMQDPMADPNAQMNPEEISPMQPEITDQPVEQPPNANQQIPDPSTNPQQNVPPTLEQPKEKKPNPFAKEGLTTQNKGCPHCEYGADGTHGDDALQKHIKAKHGASESCKPCRKTMAREANITKFETYVWNQIQVLQKKSKSGESVSLMYGLPSITSEGRKIKGTLAYAGVSLNDRIYLPEELAKGHGKTLPLLLNHSSIAGAEDELDRLDDEMLDCLYTETDYQVGEVTLTWDPAKLTLFYQGVVDNKFFQKEIDDMDMAVSLGIYYDSDSPRVCNDNCYTLIKGAEFREVSLVYHAGFPIATIEAVEAKLKKRALRSIEKEEKLSDVVDRVNKKNEPEGGWKEEDRVEESKDTDDYEHDEYKNDADSNFDNVEKSNKEDVKKFGSIEAEANEEEDDLSRGGSVDVEEKPEGDAPTIDLNDEWNGATIVTEMYTPDNFSVRGVSGMTISNANGVEKYTFDPTMNYSTNTIHFQTFGDGASIYGETLQPKMGTPDDITKIIEKQPDIVVEDGDKDAFETLKKNQKK